MYDLRLDPVSLLMFLIFIFALVLLFADIIVAKIRWYIAKRRINAKYNRKTHI